MLVNDTMSYHTTDAAYDAKQNVFTLPAEMMDGDGIITKEDVTTLVKMMLGK